MDKIPYMPELESVEFPEDRKADRNASLSALVIYSVMIFVMFLYFKFIVKMQFIHSFPMLITIIIVAVVILAAFASAFLGTRYYQKSDKNGLFSRSISGSRFIRWNDVTDVTTNTSQSETGYILKSQESSIKVTESDYNLKLIASIWQHLDKVGKSDGMLLSKGAFAAWKLVPDDVPTEFDWTNPNPPNYILYTVLEYAAYAVLITVLVMNYLMLRDQWLRHPSVFLPLIALFVFTRNIINLSAYGIPKRVALNDGNLHAEMYRKSIDVSLAEVKSASWEDEKLHIMYGRWKRLMIPQVPEDPVSTQLLLAIIRQLRLSPSLMFMPIPKELLNLKEDDA